MDPTTTLWTDESVPHQSRPAIVAACRLLLEATQFAAGSDHDPWQFAVELNCLLLGGSTPSVVRWLTRWDFVQYRIETTPSNGKWRRFRESRSLRFDPRSCFVLTEKGLTLALAVTSSGEECPGHNPGAAAKYSAACGRWPEKPRWDALRRRLFAGRQLLHEYSPQAHNRILILTVFQEEQWPEWIDDPLPGREEGDPLRRLKEAVHGLNHDQRTPQVHFSTVNEKTAVAWEWATAARSKTSKGGVR
jgi:hypothetical protein